MIRRVVVCGLVKILRIEAQGKPSLNRANCHMLQTRNLCDLPMSRLNRGLNRVEDRTHLG